MPYKLFGKHTGLRVSELVLGAGVFGTRWGHGVEPKGSNFSGMRRARGLSP